MNGELVYGLTVIALMGAYVLRELANVRRTNRDMRVAKSPSQFAGIGESKANESRHARREVASMGHVFWCDLCCGECCLPEQHGAKSERKANATRHACRELEAM